MNLTDGKYGANKALRRTAIPLRSVARGDSGPESDVDLLVKMEEGRSLLDLSAMVLDLEDSGYVGRGEGP